MDDDLMEALGFFSEDVTSPSHVSSYPVVIGSGNPTKPSEADLMDETIDSMLLSLDFQQLLSSEQQNRVMPLSEEAGESVLAMGSPVRQREQQAPSSPKKVDRRLRPHSTCKRRNRRRPKHELAYLRAKIVELQEQLATLSKANVDSLTTVDQETALAAKMGFSSWKEVAARQKHGVNSSIAENNTLRNRLLGQLQVAHFLEATIRQYQKETGMSSVGLPRAINITDHDIFAGLNGGVENQLTEVNTMLTTKGLANVLHQLRGGFDFRRESNGIRFRYEETRLLPFSMPSLHHALWNCLHNGAVVKQTQAQILNRDHSNIVFRQTIELPESRRINITKRAVFVRHIEKDRVIFVWSSYVEIDGAVFVRLREKGWSSCSTFDLYRGVNAGASSSSNFDQSCLNRLTIQLTPEVGEFQSAQEAQRYIGEMTNLIEYCYRQSFRLIHEVVERSLLTSDSSTTKVNVAGGR